MAPDLSAEAVDLSALAKKPRLPSGGWVIGGMVDLSCAVEGYLGLELLAQADLVAVMWTAVSQSSRAT